MNMLQKQNKTLHSGFPNASYLTSYFNSGFSVAVPSQTNFILLISPLYHSNSGAICVLSGPSGAHTETKFHLHN